MPSDIKLFKNAMLDSIIWDCETPLFFKVLIQLKLMSWKKWRTKKIAERG
jgi:hypothetical protein